MGDDSLRVPLKEKEAAQWRMKQNGKEINIKEYKERSRTVEERVKQCKLRADEEWGESVGSLQRE